MSEYTVVTLGLKGSGKTAYLATLNHMLSRGQLADGLVITARPAAANRRLEELYNQYVDPAKDWPDGTQKAEAWTFACLVRARRRSFPILELVYLDYAGEWAAPSQRIEPDLARDFFEHLDHGSAMLALIDGELVLDLFEGRLSEDQFYQGHVDELVSWMNYCPGPIHIVVSKWDLLAARGHTLVSVKDRLLDLDDGRLRKIVGARKASSRVGLRHGVVRLIPVSSLWGLAYLGPDGKMHKNPDVRPFPLNVDIPLIAVLPDLCLGAAEELQHRLENVGSNQPAVPGTADWLAGQLDSASGLARGRVLPVVMLAMATAVGLIKVSGRAMRPVRRLARRRRRRLRGIRTQEAALIYACRALNRRLKDFQDDYPGSRLA